MQLQKFSEKEQQEVDQSIAMVELLLAKRRKKEEGGR